MNAASSFDNDADFIKYSNPDEPFADKDARFQAWVLYPGAEFRGKTIVAQGGIWLNGQDPEFYENNAHTVGGVTYYGLGAENSANISAFFEIGKGATSNHAYFWNSSFGIRKFLDPSQALKYSTNPWYDIRYAEILLNYAEAVVESGKGDAAIAKKALNDIRHRAAFTDDIDLTLENVLHERKVEFAFEGHESYTLHRRREYLNTRSGNQYRKHTLLPVLDLRDGEPQYIFARVNLYHGDVQFSATGLNTEQLDYYKGIPNFNVNRLTPNPSQE